MKYLMVAIYGILVIIFFCLTFGGGKKMKAKEQTIYKPYDAKVKKVIPPFVKLSGILFGISIFSRRLLTNYTV